MVNTDLQEQFLDAIVFNKPMEFLQLIKSPELDLEYRYDRAVTESASRNTFFENATALYIANRLKRDSFVEELLRESADPQALVMNDMDTPIHDAVFSRRLKPLRMMLARLRDKDIELPDGTTLLDNAVNRADDDTLVLSELLDAGISPNHFKRSVEPPLFRLENNGVGEVVAAVLLRAGADMKLRNSQGQTLFEAVGHDLRAFFAEHVSELRQSLQKDRSFGAPVSQSEPQANAELLQVAGAGLLGEMFSAKRWRGAIPEAFAMYDRVKEALPDYYKNKLVAEVDLTPLRRHSGIASPKGIERLKRGEAEASPGGRNPW